MTKEATLSLSLSSNTHAVLCLQARVHVLLFTFSLRVATFVEYILKRCAASF